MQAATQKSTSGKKWVTVASDDAVTARLSSETGMPSALCRILSARGYDTSERVDAFLNPRLSNLSDPFRLPGMQAAVERIARALQDAKPIIVFGDYDVDGITSTALLTSVLEALGAKVHPYLPHRVDDGYGLGVEPLMRCIEEYQPGCVITVDCGTGSVEAVLAARERGVDVVVTDHHEPGPEVAPAYAVVNPKLSAGDPDLRVLAGVGVAFKLCHALLKHLRENGSEAGAQPDLRAFLELVAIGTIADMVPLSHENRILVRHGLSGMNRTVSPGLRALLNVAGVKDVIDTYHVGFLLGPRLNAAGRMGTAKTSLELLLSQDPEQAAVLADELHAANRERQTMEARIVEEAMADIEGWFDPQQHYGIVVARRNWHPGVIGIVASRICARYHRPVAVVAIDDEGIGKGSCRSISPFHMVEGLGDCGSLLRRFGGHAMAAGLEIEERHVESFRKQFNEAARSRLAPEDLLPEQRIDAWLRLGEINEPFMEGLDRMGPFGLENPKPVWAARELRLLGEPRIVGEKHVKMVFLDGNDRLDAIAFNMAGHAIPDGQLDVVFQVNRNVFRGRETLQMVVQDWRASG